MPEGRRVLTMMPDPTKHDQRDWVVLLVAITSLGLVAAGIVYGLIWWLA